MLESAELELLFDSLPEAILLCDPDGCIVYCNPRVSGLLGYSAAELKGRAVETLLPPALRQRHVGQRNAYTSAPRLRGMNQLQGIKALHQDGSEVPVTIGLSPLPAASGNLVIVSLRAASPGTSTGVQPDDAGRNQLQRLESLGLLAAGIAHDIKNLLTVVAGNAELMMHAMPETDPLQANARAILGASLRLGQLSQSVLSVAGGSHAAQQPVHLDVMVRELTGLLAQSLPAQVRVELDLAADLPPLQADPGVLAQILLNLIHNAGVAIGNKAGTIRVETRLVHLTEHHDCGNNILLPVGSGPHLRLRISDDGHGVSTELRTRIFEPFYTTRSEGKGLGLALVHGIVQRLGGGLCLSSTPGEGARFTVYLPMPRPQAAASPAAAAPA